MLIEHSCSDGSSKTPVMALSASPYEQHLAVRLNEQVISFNHLC